MPTPPKHLLLPLALFACSTTEKGSLDDPWADDAFVAEAHEAVEQYVHVVIASYEASVAAAEVMAEDINEFLDDPNEATLALAKISWLAARDIYGQTEVYRFYGGPIDVEPGGLEGQINAWPMDEAYIDYVEGDPNAGIINDLTTYPKIDRELLISLNTAAGEDSISTGWHAIEFLLWGQDESPEGPGVRSDGDYHTTGEPNHPNPGRRGDYLRVVTELLVDDLKAVNAAWAEDAPYHDAFEHDQPPKDALTKVLLGMGSLSGAELSGERMAVAFDTREQEDEHSCFSDNTHNDFIANARGIENVYLGRWDTGEGPSLSRLVARLDPELDSKLKEQLAATNAAMTAIPAPFDQAIVTSDGREAVAAAIAALKTQTETIVEVASLLDISLNLE